ncbi:MAG TPA: hypothetical protein V6C65_18730, partial [Allocoleopsis sp.]
SSIAAEEAKNLMQIWPDYIDNMVYMVGVRLLNQTYHLYIKGRENPLTIPISWFGLQTEPVNPSIGYSSRESALEAIGSKRGGYAYWRTTEKYILPTHFTPTSAPTINMLALATLQEASKYGREVFANIAVGMVLSKAWELALRGIGYIILPTAKPVEPLPPTKGTGATGTTPKGQPNLRVVESTQSRSTGGEGNVIPLERSGAAPGRGGTGVGARSSPATGRGGTGAVGTRGEYESGAATAADLRAQANPEVPQPALRMVPKPVPEPGLRPMPQSVLQVVPAPQSGSFATAAAGFAAAEKKDDKKDDVYPLYWPISLYYPTRMTFVRIKSPDRDYTGDNQKALKAKRQREENDPDFRSDKYHVHHIVPLFLGGEDNLQSISKGGNGVILYATQHLTGHQELRKQPQLEPSRLSSSLKPLEGGEDIYKHPLGTKYYLAGFKESETLKKNLK